MATDAEALPAGEDKKQNEALVITASSLGTVFEWYDFYLYGLLATALKLKISSFVNYTWRSDSCGLQNTRIYAVLG